MKDNKISYVGLVKELESKLETIQNGGGISKIQELHKKGKMSARERINYLIDSDMMSLEIAPLAGDGMYEEYGGCVSGGVVVYVAYICRKLCVIVANDPTVKAGAWFPITAKKNLRAQEIALENRLPIIYLVDSAGIFLPLQDEIFADKYGFGRVFHNNAIMSSEGIPQIAAIMGSCVAGGAYLPILSDEVLIVENNGSVFLAGPYLVKSAIGESIDKEILGGSKTHCEISGIADYKCKDEKSCLKTIRKLINITSISSKSVYKREKSYPSKKTMEYLYQSLPKEPNKPYDTSSVISWLVDNSEFEEYKSLYGKTILCVYAKVRGWNVGIVANQRKVVRNAKGELQMGGVIYGDSADKAARFIMNCNQKKVPIIFLQDVTGFMVGSKAEHSGIIKDGAKMVSAMANSVVPKFTFIIGNSYGAGNYAMCGSSYNPKFIFAWPNARIGVMSGESAANTLLQIKINSLKEKNKTLLQKDRGRNL